MLQIIISLLLALGIRFDAGQQVTVIVESTGESYGVGSTAGSGLGIVTDDKNAGVPTQVYMLVQDENGNYSLVRR